MMNDIRYPSIADRKPGALADRHRPRTNQITQLGRGHIIRVPHAERNASHGNRIIRLSNGWMQRYYLLPFS
jgi:hypothetical protein